MCQIGFGFAFLAPSTSTSCGSFSTSEEQVDRMMIRHSTMIRHRHHHNQEEVLGQRVSSHVSLCWEWHRYFVIHASYMVVLLVRKYACNILMIDMKDVLEKVSDYETVQSSCAFSLCLPTYVVPRWHLGVGYFCHIRDWWKYWEWIYLNENKLMWDGHNVDSLQLLSRVHYLIT